MILDCYVLPLGTAHQPLRRQEPSSWRHLPAESPHFNFEGSCIVESDLTGAIAHMLIQYLASSTKTLVHHQEVFIPPQQEGCQHQKAQLDHQEACWPPPAIP
jgi:hypothetical protein